MKYNHLYQDRENAGPSNIIYFNKRVCVCVCVCVLFRLNHRQVGCITNDSENFTIFLFKALSLRPGQWNNTAMTSVI